MYKSGHVRDRYLDDCKARMDLYHSAVFVVIHLFSCVCQI